MGEVIADLGNAVVDLVSDLNQCIELGPVPDDFSSEDVRFSVFPMIDLGHLTLQIPQVAAKLGIYSEDLVLASLQFAMDLFQSSSHVLYFLGKGIVTGADGIDQELQSEEVAPKIACNLVI